MFAVIKSGGKQYKIALGSILKLEKIDAEKNNSVVFKEVLMIKNETSYELGSPFLSNVEVKGKILENKKDKKVIVFKKKRRKGYKVKNGHRQMLTKIKIESISVGKSKKTTTKKEETTAKKTTAKKTTTTK